MMKTIFYKKKEFAEMLHKEQVKNRHKRDAEKFFSFHPLSTIMNEYFVILYINDTTHIKEYGSHGLAIEKKGFLK